MKHPDNPPSVSSKYQDEGEVAATQDTDPSSGGFPCLDSEGFRMYDETVQSLPIEPPAAHSERLSFQ